MFNVTPQLSLTKIHILSKTSCYLHEHYVFYLFAYGFHWGKRDFSASNLSPSSDKFDASKKCPRCFEMLRASVLQTALNNSCVRNWLRASLCNLRTRTEQQAVQILYQYLKEITISPIHTFKTSSITVVAAAISALIFSAAPAWSQSSASSGTSSMAAPASKATADMKAATAENPSKVSRADAKLMADLAQANMAEVDAGKLALEKSNDAATKRFAQMMIDDHTAALGEVETLATSKGVTLPTGPSVMQKTKATALKALSGNLFDKEYAKHAGVRAHETTVKLLKKIQKDGKDADLKALADKLLPKVEGHLAEAKTLAAAKKS